MSIENNGQVSLIAAKVLDQFVSHHPFSHYQKASKYATYLETIKQYPTMLLGFYQKQELVATAVLALIKSPLLGVIGYIPTGLCVDYDNHDLVQATHYKLIEFARAQSLVSIIIDPNVLHLSRDLQGNPTGLINNQAMTQLLESIGYAHKGYTIGYGKSMRNRFTLICELNRPLEQIMAGFSKSKINKYKMQTGLGIQTIQGSKADSKHLAALEAQLASKLNFKAKKSGYFEQLFDIYQEQLVCFKTILNVELAIEALQQEIASNKYKNDQDAKVAKAKQIAQLQQLKQQGSSQLLLAIGLFVTFHDQVWDLYSYKDEQLHAYAGVDHLHISAIQTFHNLGFKSYDFVGFSGSVDPNDPYYGLYQYKSSFNPTFIEQLGEFEAVLNPKRHRIIQFVKKIKTAISWRVKKILKGNR